MVEQFILQAYGEMEPNAMFSRIFPITFKTEEDALAKRFEFARQILVDATKDESYREKFRESDLRDIVQEANFLFEGETVDWWTSNDWFIIKAVPIQICDPDNTGNTLFPTNGMK